MPHSLDATLKNFAKLSVIALLCISCSVNIPRSKISYIDPMQSEYQLWPTITDETDDFKLTLTPLQNLDNTLVFDINIVNKQLDSIYIDPSTWKMYTTSVISDSLAYDTLRVMSPEEIATTYRTLAEKFQTAKNNKQAAIIFFSIILIVGIIAVAASMDSDDDDDEEYWEDDDDDWWVPEFNISYYGGAGTNNWEEYSDAQKIRMLNTEASRFDRSAITPVVIEKGEEISFEIYFPRLDKLSAFELEWQLADSTFRYQFIHEYDGIMHP